MKKIIVVALLAIFLTPVSAQAAQTKFVGGPLTNLESQGATVHITLSEVPAKGGLYIQQCVEAPAGARPTLCNKAAELWISTGRGASFLPTDVIKFKPTSGFVSGTANVDCTISKCGVFLRFDHTVPGDLSEDQFLPLTFKAAVKETIVLAPDEITAKINGITVSTKEPITLTYRQSATIAATSKAGATLTYASLTPACSLKGVELTPLTGTGECAISVTSMGNLSAAAITAILPIKLVLGVQEVTGFSLPKTAKAATKITLPLETNFGEKIKYKVIGPCSIAASVLTVRKGNCSIIATAATQINNYNFFKAKLLIKGK